MSLVPDGRLSGSFIHSPLEEVETCLVKWGNGAAVGRLTTAQRTLTDFRNAWTCLEPRLFVPNKAILISMGEWTAFFDNHEREFRPNAELQICCEELKRTSCFFSYDDRSNSDQNGSAEFAVFQWDPVARRALQRSVVLYKEAVWKFESHGAPLSFEDTSLYEQKKKTSRLTCDLLRQYGSALGIPFWDATQYGQVISFLQWGPPPQKGVSEMLQTFSKMLRLPPNG